MCCTALVWNNDLLSVIYIVALMKTCQNLVFNMSDLNFQNIHKTEARLPFHRINQFYVLITFKRQQTSLIGLPLTRHYLGGRRSGGSWHSRW